MISNKKLGNSFEEELCENLAEKGWWSHNLSQNPVGQPADVLAVKNNIAVLIDCKVCKNNRFPLSRIEGNQEGAMTLWRERGNAYCEFALKLDDGDIYMISFIRMLELEIKGVKSLSEQDIRKFPSFDRWFSIMEELIC